MTLNIRPAGLREMDIALDWAAQEGWNPGRTDAVNAPQTYQLRIHLPQPLHLAIGRLGSFDFPAGRYAYTGSAKRHFEARVARHLRQEKSLRWHIDYLLTAPGVTVTEVIRSTLPECALNQSTPGALPVPGFGASDCEHGCGSHLKYLGR